MKKKRFGDKPLSPETLHIIGVRVNVHVYLVIRSQKMSDWTYTCMRSRTAHRFFHTRKSLTSRHLEPNLHSFSNRCLYRWSSKILLYDGPQFLFRPLKINIRTEYGRLMIITRIPIDIECFFFLICLRYVSIYLIPGRVIIIIIDRGYIV